MNVTYADNIQQGGEGYLLIQQATRRLEEILGLSSGLVSAEWDREVDKTGRSLYRLTLRGVNFSANEGHRPPLDQNNQEADILRSPLSFVVLNNFGGQASTEFTLEELRDPLQMRFCLPRLYGDLLQQWSDQQHKIVLTMLDQIDSNQGGD